MKRDTPLEDLRLLEQLRYPAFSCADADFRTCSTMPAPNWLAMAAIRCWPVRWVACCWRASACGSSRHAAVRAALPLDIERLERYVQSNLTDASAWPNWPARPESQSLPCVKDSMGLTPHQYLLKARLDHASRLLRSDCVAAGTHCRGVGAFSQSALTTAMRRYLGLTPKGLRRDG